MKYMSIDIGSTSIKTAVIDLSHRKILTTSVFPGPERKRTQSGYAFEVSASTYAAIVIDLIEHLTDTHPDIEGILLSTQMHGFVLDDTYVSWQDRSCLEPLADKGTALEELQRRIPSSRMTGKGVPLKPSLGVCNLYARLLKEDRLDYTGEVHTLGSYLIKKLTGNAICHITNAAPLGLVDIKEKVWDTQLLTDLGMTGLQLPSIAEKDFAPCGTVRINGKERKVFPDYGDQQVTVLGSGVQNNEGIVNVATAAQVIAVTKACETGAYETRPYFEGHYLKVVSGLPSGRDLQVFIGFLKDAIKRVADRAISEREIWKALSNCYTPGSYGILIDPWFCEANEDRCGSIQGIGDANFNISNVLSGMLEGMADSYLQALRQIGAKETIQGIVCAGGVSWKQPALVEAMRIKSGKPCRLSLREDEAFEGALRIACRCEEVIPTVI